MKSITNVLAILVIIITSCNSKKTEAEVKQTDSIATKEVMKPTETAIETVDSATNELVEENKQLEDELIEFENKNKEILGNWFTPHAATIKISFFTNGWFEFDNYDAELDKSEVVSGRYEFDNEKVTLLFEDKRANQVFNFSKDETASYLKAKGYYFVKEN
jgi:hypothetical protein